MSFARPWVLLLLIAPVLLVWWEWRRRGRPLVLPFDHARAKARSWLERAIKVANLLPALLLAIAVMLLAGPQRLFFQPAVVWCRQHACDGHTQRRKVGRPNAIRRDEVIAQIELARYAPNVAQIVKCERAVRSRVRDAQEDRRATVWRARRQPGFRQNHFKLPLHADGGRRRVGGKYGE